MDPATLQHLSQAWKGEPLPFWSVSAHALRASGCAAHLSAQVHLTPTLDSTPFL